MGEAKNIYFTCLNWQKESLFISSKKDLVDIVKNLR